MSGGGYYEGYSEAGRYLEKIHIPDTVAALDGFLRYRNYLKEVNIPQSLVRLSSGVLEYTAIEEITIPSKIIEIDSDAFCGCKNLKSVYICDGVTSIGQNAFCNSGVESIRLPDTLESICYFAFINCEKLHSITVPESVKNIEECAFGMYYSQVYDTYRPYSDFVVYGKSGTEAERYANDSGLKFVALDNNYYSITYMLDGGVNDVANITKISSTDSDFVLKSPKKMGYVFEGWYSDKELTHKVEKIESSTKSNVILYAKWKFVYKVYGYQLTLDSNFDLVYFIKLDDDIQSDAGAYIEFTVGDNKYTLSEYVQAGIYRAYSCEVPVKNVGDTITTKLYCDGLSYELPGYSVKEYLINIIDNKENKPEYALAKNTAIAILDYAAYAQEYFDYNVDNLANTSVTQNVVRELKEVEVIEAIDVNSKALNNEDFEYIGASLICNSDTYMRIYLSNKNNLSPDEINKKYKLYVSGGSNPVANIGVNNGVVYIELKNIPAAELDNVYVFVLEGENTEIQITYSPYAYIKDTMSSENEKLKNLCKALYLYSVAANEYYNKYSLPH